MPIPTGTAAISFSQLRDEMHIGLGNPAAYGAFPLNDATVRLKLTNTSVNAQLSLSSLRGNIYRRFNITANTTNYDIRAAFALTDSNWNGLNPSSKASADVVIGPLAHVGTPNTSAYAMDTGSFGWPASSHIYVENNGFILGHGGNGGNGGSSPGSGGGTGGAGGPALLARRAMTLVNNGTVGGGGGGGGGAPGTSVTVTTPPPVPPTAPSFPTTSPTTRTDRYAGGAGGGGRTGTTNTSGGAGGSASGGNAFPSNPGSPGTSGGAGAGSGGRGPAGAGGPGGNWGTAGTPGAPGVAAGGAAGVAIQGWSQVSTPAPLGVTGISGPRPG
jgi:hypothetical protein